MLHMRRTTVCPTVQPEDSLDTGDASQAKTSLCLLALVVNIPVVPISLSTAADPLICASIFSLPGRHIGAANARFNQSASHMAAQLGVSVC